MSRIGHYSRDRRGICPPILTMSSCSVPMSLVNMFMTGSIDTTVLGVHVGSCETLSANQCVYRVFRLSVSCMPCDA
jgi:hypothetical protein